MGIFSLFGKKDAANKGASANHKPAKTARAGSTVTSSDAENGFSNSSMSQRHIARATERKIDAIEFEMSRDIIKKKVESKSTPATPVKPAPPKSAYSTNPIPENTPRQVHSTIAIQNMVPQNAINTNLFQPTVPLMGAATEFLLSGTTALIAPLEQTEDFPAMEEAAILFASGQPDITEKTLLQITAQDSKSRQANQTAWWMLFDLYQITQNKAEFEQLSLHYVRKFEVSAPTWVESATQVIVPARNSREVEALPRVVFAGKLDNQILNSLSKLHTLSTRHTTLRIEFNRITEVDPIGCGLLLRGLQNLKKSGNDLNLIGAADLGKHIQSIIRVGRRDETEAPWLLLLEILQFLNEEKTFEDISMDYCITFEVSPPPFVRPVNVSTATRTELTTEFMDAAPFLMPKIVEGNTDQLVKAITDYAEDNSVIRLDCSQLDRVDFSSCGQLLSSLIPLTSNGKSTIEFHDINYLVLALFNAMGFKNIATMHPRKK